MGFGTLGTHGFVGVVGPEVPPDRGGFSDAWPNGKPAALTISEAEINSSSCNSDRSAALVGEAGTSCCWSHHDDLELVIIILLAVGWEERLGARGIP